MNKNLFGILMALTGAMVAVAGMRLIAPAPELPLEPISPLAISTSESQTPFTRPGGTSSPDSRAESHYSSQRSSVPATGAASASRQSYRSTTALAASGSYVAPEAMLQGIPVASFAAAASFPGDVSPTGQARDSWERPVAVTITRPARQVNGQGGQMAFELSPGMNAPIAITTPPMEDLTPQQGHSLVAMATNFADAIGEAAATLPEETLADVWQSQTDNADSEFRNIFGQAAHMQRMMDTAVKTRNPQQ